MLAVHHSDSGRWCSTKQAIYAEILINSRPVNAKTPTGDLPVITILLRRIQEPWIPSKWYGNNSPILKIDNKNVVCRSHIHDTRPRINHETPPMLFPA